MKTDILDLLQNESSFILKNSKVESSAERYCKSLYIILKIENAHYISPFINEYIKLIRGKAFPVFKISIVTILYKKWLRYPAIFNELKFLSTHIKLKNLGTEFWNQVIVINSLDKPTPKIQEARLNLLVYVINSGTLKKTEFIKYRIVIDCIIKISIHDSDFEPLKLQLRGQNNHPYFRMFYVIRKLIDLQLSGFELSEVIKKHFSSINKDFSWSEDLKAFYDIMAEKLPGDYLLHLSQYDFDKLFQFYKNYPSFFNSLKIDSLILLNRESIIKSLFDGYIISGLFLKSYATNRISNYEYGWFQNELDGKSIIYSANLPLKITKKAAHHFRLLPYDMNLSVTRGLIYSAVFTLIENERFAEVVAVSIRNLEQSEFWVKTFVSLYKNGLQSYNVREVMDYIHEKVFIEGFHLDLKNKSINNLMNDIEEWHRILRTSNELKRIGSKKLALSETTNYMIVKDEKKYEIKQIKSTRELFLEGENLEHCDYSYRNYCEKGEVFIFSLRTKDENNNKISLLTIEVVEDTIYQIKGKLNRLPNDFEMAIILGWAKEKELKYIT